MLKKCLLVSFFLLLTACGYHLRGFLPSQKNLPAIEWEVLGDADLAARVKEELHWRYPKKQAEFSPGVPAKIEIKKVQFQKSIQSFNRYGGANQSFYILEVVVEVTYQNQPWGKSIVINLRRSLPYQGNDLAREAEEKTLKEDMYQEVAQDIVNRLSFLPILSGSDLM